MSAFFFHTSAVYWLPLLALALDLAFGDPRQLPHPVRFIAFLADKMEAFCRRFFSPLPGGIVALFLVVLHVWIGVRLLMRLPVLGGLFALYFCWAGLALGSLLREGRAALDRIENGSIEEGRKAVQMLVTRDTSAMNREDLRRSLAESLSENLNDGFVAPFFWLLLAGPAGLWVYKAVSTLDSMWGHKTERYLYFGRAAALADDAMAWIPARLTALFMLLAGKIMHLAKNWPGWRVVRREAGQMESPNAGWPMAAAAWLHRAAMGGPAVYHGIHVDKPLLGPVGQAWSGEALARLIRHIRLTGLLAAVCLWLPVLFF